MYEDTEEPVVETQEEVTEEVAEETLEASDDGEEEQGTEEPAAYEPNYEFTVKDKKMEFDDWARPLVANTELEGKFREVFEKAHGLDEVKGHRESLRTELKDLKGDYSKMTEGLAGLDSYVKNKDYGSFFKTLNIPKEEILRYAIDELKYQEMSPEQRQDVEAQRTQTGRLSELEMMNQQMATQNQNMLRVQAESELNTAMSTPDVASIAQAYDARVGKPGAFRSEVINRGIQYESSSNQTITAAQAVQEIVQLVGGNVSASTQTNTTSGQPTPSQVIATQQQKPVIPNVRGSGSGSPYKKKPSSLEDLRKLRDQMTSGNG